MSLRPAPGADGAPPMHTVSLGVLRSPHLGDGNLSDTQLPQGRGWVAGPHGNQDGGHAAKGARGLPLKLAVGPLEKSSGEYLMLSRK